MSKDICNIAHLQAPIHTSLAPIPALIVSTPATHETVLYSMALHASDSTFLIDLRADTANK
jgi:hypothetical protein